MIDSYFLPYFLSDTYFNTISRSDGVKQRLKTKTTDWINVFWMANIYDAIQV